MYPESQLNRTSLLRNLFYWLLSPVFLSSTLFAQSAQTNLSVASTNLDHWAFKPIVHSPIPATKNKRWARNPIDQFILARLEKEKIPASREADRSTIIRRLYLDVLGLPPSPEEVARFVADHRKDAYEKLVEYVLASPRYGERWARHWLDVVRFAESSGFETNVPRENAWPYRDYVIRAFNEDKPFTQFILEQLAGDSCGEDPATGFLVGGSEDRVKSPEVQLTRQQRADELADMVATTGSAFLGLTVGCARCHNHKFDPIAQTDYYSMAGVFAGFQHGERAWKPIESREQKIEARKVRKELASIEGLLSRFEVLAKPVSELNTNAPHPRPPVHPRINIDRFPPMMAKFVRFTILVTSNIEPCLDELEIFSAEENSRNVALASAGAKASASGTYPKDEHHKLEHLNDGRYGNSRSWISNEQGRGWVQIELPENTLINKVVWGRDREEKYTDRLAIKYRIEVATDTNHWQLVASDADRRAYVAGGKAESNFSAEGRSVIETAELTHLLERKARLEAQLKILVMPPMIYAGAFVKPEIIHRLQRGDVMQPREEMLPGAIASLGRPLNLQTNTPESQRRLSLARWIGDAQNPLTARVIVNRLWHYHFGQGIVSTPSDFGRNGTRPSHPELLDWLASELVARGWKLKEIHRLILLSSTYRQSSQPNSRGLAIDADTRLLWRFPPRRLEAEPIRDSILLVSGKLDLKMGGPGYDVFEPNDNYVRLYNPKKEFGSVEWRRMIYQFKPRLQQDETFGNFDCPDAGQVTPRRGRSTTALQALNLLNSEFMQQQAGFLSRRLQREAGKNPSAQVKLAFQLAFNREPERKELSAAVQLIKVQGLPIFCRALYNANEFVYLF